MLIIRLMAMLIAVGADMYHIAAAEMLHLLVKLDFQFSGDWSELSL